MIPLASLAEDLAATAAEVGTTFGFKPQLFFSQVVSFLVVAALLTFFAYKPVLRMLDERRRKIEEGLAASERMQKEMAEAEQRIAEMLREAGKKADALIEEAKSSAEDAGNRKLNEASVQAAKIIESAREATALERRQIIDELKGDFARLLIDTTKRSTGRVLDESDHARLNEEAARSLAEV